MTLFGDVDDPDRYLYHYTTREAALGSIVPARQLRVLVAANKGRLCRLLPELSTLIATAQKQGWVELPRFR